MSTPMNRRQFAGAVAAGSVLISVPNDSNGAEKPEVKVSETKVTGGGDKSPSEKPSSKGAGPEPLNEADSVLELTVQLARSEFPHEKLDEAALDEIRSDVRSNLMRSKILSAFPLTNADEPGFLYGAWRSDLHD